MESEKADGILNNININIGDDAGDSNPRTRKSLEEGGDGSPHGFAKHITPAIRRCMNKFVKIAYAAALFTIFLGHLPRQNHWAPWVGLVGFLLNVAFIISKHD